MMNSHFSKGLIIAQTLIYLHLRGYSSEAVSIGIIGSGIGGGTTSYYLRKLFGADAKIDAYESKAVGGRLATIEIGGRKFEAGGSIIHKKNRYVTTLAKESGLREGQSPGGRLALYDGQEYVFTESEYTFITYAKLLYRYGMSIFRWSNTMEDTLSKFDRIYDHHDNGYSFTTVAKLLTSMDPSFVGMTQTSASKLLENNKFSERFITELGMAVTRVNYGQTTSVNGLVGMISLAAAQPGLWAVEGGNYQLAVNAFRLSEANHLPEKAEKVILDQNRRYTIESMDANSNRIKRDYDIIVIAAPQTSDLATVTFEGFPENIFKFSGHYHRTVATFVKGKLNYTYFNLENGSDPFEDIATINTNTAFNSISKVYPVDWKPSDKFPADTYKIFSQDILKDDVLNLMFVSRDETKVANWLAYPHYTPPEHLGEFVLYNRLYYTSAIEWAGSAMEMSAVAGRNVALLSYNQWNKLHAKVNSPSTNVNKKDEL